MVANPKQSQVLIWGTFCNFICTIFSLQLVKSADAESHMDKLHIRQASHVVICAFLTA